MIAYTLIFPGRLCWYVWVNIPTISTNKDNLIAKEKRWQGDGEGKGAEGKAGERWHGIPYFGGCTLYEMK